MNRIALIIFMCDSDVCVRSRVARCLAGLVYAVDLCLRLCRLVRKLRVE